MTLWEQELALVESAALRIEAIEQAAERRFDQVFADAEARGRRELALQGPEFKEWVAARADTDVAWGRWAQVMHARPEQAA